MASFTDAVPEFNPYIQQLPVEAMAQVGMAKQQRYNEGIQKIQSNIDSVAGLDIIRNVDKRYLQGKLDELGNNLRTVAAGDFSNFQLTNSVAGMTNQIARDSKIQNAVSSTAFYRKQLSEMDTARKEGKSSIVNEAFFYDRANKWINSDNIDEGFNSRYKQFIDVEKKWMDVFKSLHPSLNEQDIPYVRNPDGSVNPYETTAAMQRLSKETVSSATIENALRATMTPDELDQLNMNGWYQFRTYDTPEKLGTYSETKYNTQIKRNEDKIKELRGLANMQSDPVKKYEAEQLITQLEKLNAELPKRKQEELDLIRTNPEAAKGYIYRNGAIAQFADAYAWESNKDNMLTNPVAQYELDQKRLGLQIRAQSWNEFKDQFDMDDKRAGRAMQKYELDMKYGSPLGDAAVTYTGANTEKFDAPVTSLLNDAKGYTDSANSIITEMVNGIPDVTPEQVENAIRLYGSGNTAGGDKIIPKKWRGKVDQVIDLRTDARSINETISRTQQEVENSPAMRELKSKIDSELLSMKGIDMTTASGEKVTFTPEEVKNYLAKVSRDEKVGTSVFGFSAGTTTNTTVNKPLTEKEQILHANQSRVKGRLNEYNSKIGEAQKEINKRVDEKILERSPLSVPYVTAVTFGTEDGGKGRARWENFTTNLMMRYDEDVNGMPGGHAKFSKDDQEMVRTWMADDKSKLHYKKAVQGNDTFIIVMNGNEEVMIPVEANELSQIPMIDPNEQSPQYKRIVQFEYRGDGDTNPSGKYENAAITRTYMPNVKELQMKGDLSSDKSNPAMQYITLRLNVPNFGVVSLELEDSPVDINQALGLFRSLTDDDVKKAFLQNDSITDEMKAEIQKL